MRRHSKKIISHPTCVSRSARRICSSRVLVEAFRGTGIGVGAQNVHYEAEGAFTGEISIPMLEEIGVDYCIVGHSERRQYFNESDDTVNRKVKALLKTSIIPIVCVGEDLQQKEAGYEKQLVSEQVKNARDYPWLTKQSASSSHTNRSGPSAPAEQPRRSRQI